MTTWQVWINKNKVIRLARIDIWRNDLASSPVDLHTVRLGSFIVDSRQVNGLDREAEALHLGLSILRSQIKCPALGFRKELSSVNLHHKLPKLLSFLILVTVPCI